MILTTEEIRANNITGASIIWKKLQTKLPELVPQFLEKYKDKDIEFLKQRARLCNELVNQNQCSEAIVFGVEEKGSNLIEFYIDCIAESIAICLIIFNKPISFETSPTEAIDLVFFPNGKTLQ